MAKKRERTMRIITRKQLTDGFIEAVRVDGKLVQRVVPWRVIRDLGDDTFLVHEPTVTNAKLF